ncbi:MAG TPA: hypothetical protein PK878_12050 [bacterium]|nr:hypothetical protein [bacterium]HOL94842.1 hypothetical protein [bacterium]HPP03101.1 hypothetical protein [bacterium]
MLHRLGWIAFFMTAGMLAGGPYTAWSVRVKPLNLGELTEGARVIFEGECVEIRSGKDPVSGLVATWYTFRVTQVLKGEVGKEYVLKQYGGSDGDLHVKVPAVEYQVGEKLILFLYGESKLGFSSAVGMQQGKFSIKEIPETKVRYVTNGMPAMLLFENMPTAVVPLNGRGMKAQGTERLRSERLEISEFKQEVQRLVEAQKTKER